MSKLKLNEVAKWWFLLMGISAPLKNYLCHGDNHSTDIHFIGGFIMIGIGIIIHSLK